MSLPAEAGWFTPSLLALPLQVFAAAAAMRAFGRRIAPNIVQLPRPEGALDSLGPFSLALPLVSAGWRVEWDASGTAGWIAIGGPIIIAMLALGAAIWVGFARSSSAPTLHSSHFSFPRRESLSISPITVATWSAVGGLLLLVGAAHDLTIWTGQCAFAAGAVLLWMNTPEHSRDESSQLESQSGNGLTILLGCGLLQAAAISFVPLRFLPISAGMAIASAAMIVALGARIASPFAALRLGGWTATYGVLLGLGVMSLHQLLPTIPSAFSAHPLRSDLPPIRVAFGFGTFAIEATALLLLGSASLVAPRLASRAARLALGGLIIIAAAILAGWRMSGA